MTWWCVSVAECVGGAGAPATDECGARRAGEGHGVDPGGERRLAPAHAGGAHRPDEGALRDEVRTFVSSLSQASVVLRGVSTDSCMAEARLLISLCKKCGIL